MALIGWQPMAPGGERTAAGEAGGQPERNWVTMTVAGAAGEAGTVTRMEP